MARARVWRKKTTRYVNANTGRRTKKDDPQGIKRIDESKRFYGTLKRSDGTKKQTPLTEDETSSLALLTRLQAEADHDKALGIVPQQRKRDEPLTEYLSEYEKFLTGKNRSAFHVSTTIKRATDLFTDSSTTTPRTIYATAIVKALNTYRTKGKYSRTRKRKEKLSLETCNHYLRAVKAFTRWLWITDILPTDPMKSVSLFNADVDRKKVRRAMSVDELTLLLTTTENAKRYGGKRWMLTGKQRALLYVVAASTGLRASELASLKVSAFDLPEAGNGSVTIHANSSKGKKTVRLPLPLAVVERLRSMFDASRRTRNEYVWPGTWAKERKAGVFFKRDAKRAGLVIVNDDEETIDFHALRTSFITSLARSGVHPAIAQRLARHSTITLTMNTYTKLDDDDLRDAVNRLPNIG